MSKNRIVFALTGSIACYKACSLISKLVKLGFQVQCVASKSAYKFIGKASLEGLTDKKVIDDIFDDKLFKPHIDLVKWADLIIICPATGNIINKLVSGIADDIISSLILSNSSQKPFLIAPAMNMHMLKNPITQKSISTLKSLGAKFIPTKKGVLACGDIGDGKLADIDTIYKEILKVLS